MVVGLCFLEAFKRSGILISLSWFKTDEWRIQEPRVNDFPRFHPMIHKPLYLGNSGKRKLRKIPNP